MEERIHAEGHPNVLAEHGSTFEVTTDQTLTRAGDCILGVRGDRAPRDFDRAFVAACQTAAATITVRLEAGDADATVTGRGDPDLTFSNPRSAVGRTSEYVDDRTVMVGGDAAAADLDRGLVEALASGAALTATIRVE